MKVELYVEGAHTSAAFAAFLPLWNEAREKDYGTNRLGAPISENSAGVVVETPEPEPVKKPRGRATKAAEAEPAIRATPEDRQPPAEIEEAEIVGDVFDDAPTEAPMTREDVKLALAAYAEKFGMAKAQAEGPKLMGAPRLSALPDDQEAFAKAIKALREAVANG